MVVLSTSVVNVALLHLRDGVGLSGTGMSWVVTAHGLAFGALLLLDGRAADMAGARRVLVAGLVLFAAASVAAGLAGSASLLIGARAAQGVGAAAVAPAALALVVRIFPVGGGRVRALGLWGAVSGADGAAGVLFAGLLTGAFGWPWIFHVCVFGAVLALVAALRLVPADSGGPRGGPGGPRIDVFGALPVTAVFVALVHALTTARTSGWADPLVLGPLLAVGLLLLLFLRAERCDPAPLLPPRLSAQGLVARPIS
ncbi:MFS transporter [Streptomyces sp. 15-116A]|uniref:MFS transporter n=1 Tax=Streptomyces sp. 15-116A TaxID=2259035 RepID=UPI0021B43FC5|nr:MFS transporter [Streptomyces sp. 15-116A]MCT7351129.1 MFS transporter [Streptomyces sp. 15-116A]